MFMLDKRRKPASDGIKTGSDINLAVTYDACIFNRLYKIKMDTKPSFSESLDECQTGYQL